MKLKARLLNLSVDLFVGKYIAGSPHLYTTIESIRKDEHLKDDNHKYRQKYDVMVHITSDAVQNILSTIPDAKGKIFQLILDSNLDKNLDITDKIRKAWYTAFFLRYWQ